MIKRYSPDLQGLWDIFVEQSFNATFLHKRNYMEYHKDRFADHSLLFYKDDELIGLLPANEANAQFYTHQGLTYGGILVGPNTSATKLMDMMNSLVGYLRSKQMDRCVYKAIPHIYHTRPVEEDLYALFRLGFQLTQRGISSAIRLPMAWDYTKGRKALLSRARKMGVKVLASYDLKMFHNILTEHLAERHDVEPTHTLPELLHLSNLFPKNIELWVCRLDGKIVAGTLVYVTREVAHTQYIAATEEGRIAGAQELLLDHLIREKYRKKRWFDFGISTEDGGQYLNEGLVANKESYGATGVVYDTYELKLS